MFYVIDNFFLENITDVALVNSLSALMLGKQYVALTKKACSAIKIEKEIGVNRNVMKMKEMTVKEVCDLLKEGQKHSEYAGILSGGGCSQGSVAPHS